LKHSGFSLVEVVLALGIISFAGMALLGLFSIGLDTNRDSMEELEATHIAQTLMAERRAVPVPPDPSDPSTDPDFVLDPLNVAKTVSKLNPMWLDSDGAEASSQTDASFGMIYEISPQPLIEPTRSEVHLCIFWPALAGADNAQGRVEIFTVIPLP
jgi:type II secretory pathway pseudopilin PulG